MKPEKAAELIRAGGTLLIAAEEAVLRALPAGNWIGGTTPYFMTGVGGMNTGEMAYVQKLPADAAAARIRVYDGNTLPGVYRDAPENGFSVIIIPASSGTHLSFALNAPGYEGFATSPLAGWIAGVRIEEIGRVKPKVVDGGTGKLYEDAAVVMHAELPKGRTAVVGILNIFEPSDGDVLTFPESGFGAKKVLVAGKTADFREYIREKGLDLRLPLVANYGGAMVNVSFQSVDEASGEVRFFAPVFKNVEYRHARPVGDYLMAFMDQRRKEAEDRMVFSCNCVLNYRYAGLEGKSTGGFTGPITFGEVAYQLMNQTAVYIEVATANLAERLRAETAMRRQNRLLNTLMDTMPDPVCYKGTDGRLLGCNKAYAQLVGLPAEKVLGRTVRELFPGEIAEVIERSNHRLLTERSAPPYEIRVPDGAGGTRDLIISSAVFFSAGGEAAGIIGVGRDVTELRRTGEELRLFRDLIESSSDSVMIMAPGDWRLLDVNVMASESLGYSRPELLGLRFPELCSGKSAERDWVFAAEELRSGKQLLIAVEARRKDGETFPAEVNARYAALGGREYIVGIMRDTTERVKMEATLRELHTLQGLIPICANCKKVRNDSGYWERVETYLGQRSKVQFTHGLCDECVNKLYGDKDWFRNSGGDKV